MPEDPITRILTHAEALKDMAEVLEDEKAGLALILELMGKDLQNCGERLDDEEKGDE